MKKGFNKFTMMNVVLVLLILVVGPQLARRAHAKTTPPVNEPIDKAWWDGLSDEWRNILLINQRLHKNHVDIFALQERYINRMQAAGAANLSPLNTALYELNEQQRFGTGYPDLYARAVRLKWVVQEDSIDLATLHNLDTLYMVNGPGDLTPLTKLTGLKVLIMNYCGINVNSPLRKQKVDLETLRFLPKLEVLHCAYTCLQSLKPLKILTHLRDLDVVNGEETDLSPLKNLLSLEKLSCGPQIKNESVIGKLVNLKELYWKGCQQIPDLSRLQQLQRLSVSEGEMAIVRASYRITDINHVKDLKALEYLDLNNTSYKGSIDILSGLPHLKAVTLPPVSSTIAKEFTKQHATCVVINAYQYER